MGVKYDDLVRILEDEVKKSTLSKLWFDFYKELHEYIKELEIIDQKISRRHSEEAIMIQYELKNALSTVGNIFNIRIRKIIKMASGKAFSKNPTIIAHDIENMTPEERNIYQQVLDAILLGKKNTIEPILGNGTKFDHITQSQDIEQQVAHQEKPDIGPAVGVMEYMSDQELALMEQEAAKIRPDNHTSPIDNATQPPENTVSAHTPAVSGEGDTAHSDEKGKKDLNKEYIVVRILKDLPIFIGTDGRNYTLSSQDVAVLPKVNAKALVKRKVAVQLEST
jgi:DNA replication factor GINS